MVVVQTSRSARASVRASTYLHPVRSCKTPQDKSRTCAPPSPALICTCGQGSKNQLAQRRTNQQTVPASVPAPAAGAPWSVFAEHVAVDKPPEKGRKDLQRTSWCPRAGTRISSPSVTTSLRSTTPPSGTHCATLTICTCKELPSEQMPKSRETGRCHPSKRH